MSDYDARELRKRVLNDVAKKAERDFADTRFNWLRTRPRRRLLVGVTYSLVLVYAFSNYNDLPLLTLPAFLLFIGCVLLLRISVRGVTDYPDEIVDERIREERGYTYRYAFMGVIIFMSAYIVFFIGNALLAKAGYLPSISARQLHDLSFALFFGSMALPSAIWAWNETEPEPVGA